MEYKREEVLHLIQDLQKGMSPKNIVERIVMDVKREDDRVAERVVALPPSEEEMQVQVVVPEQAPRSSPRSVRKPKKAQEVPTPVLSPAPPLLRTYSRRDNNNNNNNKVVPVVPENKEEDGDDPSDDSDDPSDDSLEKLRTEVNEANILPSGRRRLTASRDVSIEPISANSIKKSGKRVHSAPISLEREKQPQKKK